MAKQAVCKKVYIDKAGKEHASLPADPSNIAELQFRFMDKENTVLSFVPGDYSKRMVRAFMFFGASEALGNSYAGVSGDAIAAVDQWKKRNNTILADAWSSRAGGGGSRLDSLLAEALLAYFADIGKTTTKDGVPIDASWVREFLLAEDVDDDAVKETRKTRKAAWMANNDVKAHYERLRAVRVAAQTSTGAAASAEDI